MTLRGRPFSDDTDRPLMMALCNRFPADHFHRIDLPYRLSSWVLDEAENARLWFDSSGELVCWVVMQSPFWTIDIGCDPGQAERVLPQALAWASGRARTLMGTHYDRPRWYVMAFANSLPMIRALSAAGYTDQSTAAEDPWSKVWMELPGGQPVEAVTAPAGFKVRPLAGEDEAAAYVDLHQAVFESKNMTLPWRQNFMRHSDYQPDLDLVVETPGGRLGAFCTAWLNQNGDRLVGQIEPLGSHWELRQLGLGRLVLTEALRRLQARGAQSVYVETDNSRDAAMQLYESVGFKPIRNVLVFRKDL